MGPLEVNENSPEDYHDKVLGSVKAQVKAIMEESVTKKFVHEESEHVLRLCITIHSCLLNRLKKRTAGFLRSNSIANLFNKVGKSLPDIAQLVTKIEETQSAIERQLSQNGKKGNVIRPQSLQLQHLKYIWVRLALTDKKLDEILEFLVDNNAKYYEKDSIFSDPVRGRILSSLLVGPCALEYTKMKTSDHYWSDPPADELLQRHKLHCRNEDQSPSGRRKKLQSLSKYSSTEPEKSGNTTGAGSNFRDYVESLHQNSKSTLLYGKNNVVVQPTEEMTPIHGYLSLHQVLDSIFIKWTPNQLMNVNEHSKSVNCNHDTAEMEEGVEEEESRLPLAPKHDVKGVVVKQSSSFLRRGQADEKPKNVSSYWEYAISVNVKDVVYLHCHHRNGANGTLVLVGQDGVQRPPICFPPGGHLLAFLTCLETGLLPLGHLDPPLWSQHGTGKVFPKLRKRTSQSSTSSDDVEATDFVFRVTSGNPKANSQRTIISDPIHENFDAYAIGPAYTCYNSQDNSYSSRSSLRVLCHTMRRQIISRAFYGWLAHCRHLSTVRTHLSALILPDSSPLEVEQESPINLEVWSSFLEDGKIVDTEAMMKRVYFGGIQHEMRIIIWPFLLNHYPLDSNCEERERIDAESIKDYEDVMREWRVAETTIVQRQKRSLAAKLSYDSFASSSSSLDGPLKQFVPVMRKQSTMSDVFASLDQDASTSADVNSSSLDSSQATNNLRDRVMRKRYAMKDGSDPSKSDSKASDHTPYSSMSTDYSNVAQRCSSITSSVLDAVGDSINEDMKLDNIVECQPESEITSEGIAASESGSDSKSANRKPPSLVKQDGIDMEAGLNQGESQDLDEVDESYLDRGSPVCELSNELLESFGLNLHRIEKDVHRCDRNHEYFTNGENLEKLRNIMCSYVWRHLDIGYMQGMCDLAAPLLLLMDDESKVFSCFCKLMQRMENNFPTGKAMDAHFANMRSLIQVLDSELFELMHQKGDYTHFYFCYRWFLLDFKRELSYDNDVFVVWETIWAARHVCSEQFVLFFALALLHNYRDIVLDNEMDFTDIIKFFNEMAERHNANKILKIAQNFVYEVQSMISK